MKVMLKVGMEYVGTDYGLVLTSVVAVRTYYVVLHMKRHSSEYPFYFIFLVLALLPTTQLLFPL